MRGSSSKDVAEGAKKTIEYAVDDLIDAIERLEKEKDALQDTIDRLTKENETLKEDVKSLENSPN